MDNQHEKIKGYRDLTQEEIDLMNEVKELAEKCGDLINKLEHSSSTVTSLDTSPTIDKRWVIIAKDNLQLGFMAAVRSVAKPTAF